MTGTGLGGMRCDARHHWMCSVAVVGQNVGSGQGPGGWRPTGRYDVQIIQGCAGHCCGHFCLFYNTRRHHSATFTGLGKYMVLEEYRIYRHDKPPQYENIIIMEQGRATRRINWDLMVEK